MLNKFRLQFKFTLLLSVLFLASTGLSALLISGQVQDRASQQVVDRAMTLMETISSVRDYTSQKIQPLLAEKIETKEEFVAESVPAYSAREVFERLRQKMGYEDFFYKEAALNPTNLRDLANEFETSLVERFRQQQDIPKLFGFQTIAGKQLFYVSRPLRMTDPSCLRCHSTPEAAPKSHLKTYGNERGFNWKLNDVVAAQTLYMPSDRIVQSYQHQFLIAFGAFVGIFALIILVLNLLLTRSVIQPLHPIAKIANALNQENADIKDEDLQKLNRFIQRRDEMGQLARSFRHLATSIWARENSLKQQLEMLHQEVLNARSPDETVGTQSQVQALLAKAKVIRSALKVNSTHSQP